MSENGKSITTAEEFARIAKITSDAMRASGDKMIADVKQTIEAAESTTSMLRLEADNLVESIRAQTAAFADRVSAYVDSCHQAIMTFREHQTRLSNVEAVSKTPAVVSEKMVSKITDLDEKLRRANMDDAIN